MGCRNPDNVHCFETIFRVPIQFENKEVAQLSSDKVGPARLIPMGRNKKQRCNSEFAKRHDIYTPEKCVNEWIQNTLQWRHDELDSVSNHQPDDCLLNVYSDADQRKYQSSASLAFVRGIHRRPVNSPHKGPVTRKTFLFDDVIMSCPASCSHWGTSNYRNVSHRNIPPDAIVNKLVRRTITQKL